MKTREIPFKFTGDNHMFRTCEYHGALLDFPDDPHVLFMRNGELHCVF